MTPPTIIHSRSSAESSAQGFGAVTDAEGSGFPARLTVLSGRLRMADAVSVLEVAYWLEGSGCGSERSNTGGQESRRW